MHGKTKIIFNTNIWVSFTIGKRLDKLRYFLYNKHFEVYICDRIIEEYLTVVKRKKIAKYITTMRVSETLEIIKMTTTKVKISKSHLKYSRDKNDDFLLLLSDKVNANYLVTGDDDLLVMKKHSETDIINFEHLTRII